MSFNQLNAKRHEFEKNVKKGLQAFSTEGKKVLRDLGVRGDAYKLNYSNIQEIFADIKHFNQTPKAFIKNLDYATYEARQQFNWNKNMLLAYARQQIDQQVGPKFDTYKGRLRDQVTKIKPFPFKKRERIKQANTSN